MFTGFVAIFIFPTVKDGSIPQNDNSCHFRAIRVRNIVKKDIKNIIKRNGVA
jgi:hypothetical protein